MAMNNKALKAIMDAYGSKVKGIRCENTVVQLNQSLQNIPAVTNDDIQYKTFGDEDFFIFPRYDAHHKKFFDVIVKTNQVEDVYCTRNENDPLDFYSI